MIKVRVYLQSTLHSSINRLINLILLKTDLNWQQLRLVKNTSQYFQDKVSSVLMKTNLLMKIALQILSLLLLIEKDRPMISQIKDNQHHMRKNIENLKKS